jgi:hypothetical protein
MLQDLRFIGQLKHGVYDDDCKGVHPDVINQYYGTSGDRSHRPKSQTGAGHPKDEAESDSEMDTSEGKAVLQGINSDQWRHVRHEGIDVPHHYNPFGGEGKDLQFFEVLAKVVEQEVHPNGYGLHPNEWEEESYPVLEWVRAGKRGNKEIQVSLENTIWMRRAVLWVQGLAVLSQFQE